MGTKKERGESSLDLLEAEDNLLLELFTTVERNLGSSVEERYEYGSAAKQIIHHSAIRRAAVMDVVAGTESVPDLGAVAERLRERTLTHLERLDELDDRSRSIQGMYLNEGQDFDGPLQAFIGLARGDIEWELSAAVPEIRSGAAAAGAQIALKRAHYIRRHAPTTVGAGGPGWFVRNPLVSRVSSALSFLRDHPRAPREERVRT